MSYPAPGESAWGAPPLPEWVHEFRPPQIQAVEEAVGHFAAGKRVVFLDAPTGTGKTLIAEMIRRRMRVQAMYLCTTKTLQAQFAHDFDYCRVLMGRSNYPTADRPDLFPMLNAGDCDKVKGPPGSARCVTCPDEPDTEWTEPEETEEEIWHCSWCHPVQHCPYEGAKRGFIGCETMAVTNTAYALTEWNGPGRLSAWRESTGTIGPHPFPLVVIDEADTLEAQLMSHIEFALPRTLVRQLRLDPPEKKTVPSAWAAWAYEVGEPKLTRHLEKLKGQLRAAQNRQADPKEQAQLTRAVKSITAHRGRLKAVSGQLGSERWVYTGYDRGEIAFKPVAVAEIAHEKLWNHARQFLLMSATIISPDQMAADLGLAPGDWASVRVGSGFPPERRPILIRPVAPMTYANKDEAWPKLVPAINEIMARYPRERVLVHTVSYGLSSYLTDQIRSPRCVTYRSAGERDGAITEFLAIPNGVLFASSLDRGIDLPDDACRVVVIAKIPYPALGDKQISARLHSPGGQAWYTMHTVRTMVQQSGRGMRHEGDWCDTWVLDGMFLKLWQEHRDMIPEWWQEAIVWHTDRLESHLVRYPGGA